MSNVVNRVSLIAGLVFGVLLLHYFGTTNVAPPKFEDLALGTTTSLASVNGGRVHCHDLDDAEQCMAGYKKTANDRPVVLWLGNSQVHAIN